ncbi:NAD-dependent epimerase/dehydratase family protein [Candidatus Pseudothioglobus singularis]|nr:NAD-dependent epimerase/dehydratase family protein [Candidatus Pseudothioglobus singularis]
MYLVTGGNGFIGRSLVNALEASGHEVTILSRRSIKGYKTLKCDLLANQVNIDDLKGIKTIFHLVGYTHDLSSKNNDYLYKKLNVDATVSLANLAGSAGVKSFIFISSVKAGGFEKETYLDEETQLEPEGIYGKTKREAELRVLDIGQKYNMHVSIVRPSLVYGPGVKGNLRSMIKAIEKGWFPPLPEIGNRRSMIHVDDLVTALILVSKKTETNGEIFIATDGNPYSSREIYETICSVVGKSIPNWSVPFFFFNFLGFMNLKLHYKIMKLLGDEYYSSAKLHSIGFSAKKTFRNINETSF